METTLGQIAYEGYCESSGNKSLVSGAELPCWSVLRVDIKLAWEMAAQRVKTRLEQVKVVEPTDLQTQIGQQIDNLKL